MSEKGPTKARSEVEKRKKHVDENTASKKC